MGRPNEISRVLRWEERGLVAEREDVQMKAEIREKRRYYIADFKMEERDTRLKTVVDL